MPASQLPAPARRADAERNRDKILAAARTAFADPDAEVSTACALRPMRSPYRTRRHQGLIWARSLPDPDGKYRTFE